MRSGTLCAFINSSTSVGVSDIAPSWLLRKVICIDSTQCVLSSIVSYAELGFASPLSPVFHLNHICTLASSLLPFFPFVSPTVQINSRPSPRPAGGSTARQRGPCEGHHLWHPKGGVSGVPPVVGHTLPFLSLCLPFPSLSSSSLPSVHCCFCPSVLQKLRK